MLHVHHHPVIQKVIIGMFVFGMTMFGMRVAFGAMTFPLPTEARMPKTAVEILLPVDMPKLLESVPLSTAEVPDQEEMMRREEEQKKINAQALEQMIRGGDDIARMLKGISARLDTIDPKSGKKVPSDFAWGAMEIQDLLDKLNNAKDTQSAQDILQQLQEQSRSYFEDFPKVDLTMNASSVMMQVEKEYSRLKKAVEVQHPKLAKLDPTLVAAVGDPADGVGVIRAALDDIKLLSPAEISRAIHGDVFKRFQNVWQQYGVLEALRNPRTTLIKIQTQLKANDRLIMKLTKSGSAQVEQLSKLQIELKAAAANIKTLLAGKDSKAIYDSFSMFADLQQQFETLLGESLNDHDPTNDKLGDSNHWGVPTFGPPSGLPGSAVTDEKTLKMLENLAPYLPKSTQ